MFNHDEIVTAVDLQQRSYRLLKWVTEAVDRGFIDFHGAHEYSSLPEAALQWMEEHYLNLPIDARPERDLLEPFANFFSTYLETSFDLVSPGKRLYSPDAFCFCPMCSWLIDTPRLKAKKLSKFDKRRSKALMAIAAKTMALELGFTLNDEEAEKTVLSEEVREAFALCAYGNELVRRMKGFTEGPPTLALWRQFAWTGKGSPKKNFKLSADMILEAEQKCRMVLEQRRIGEE